VSELINVFDGSWPHPLGAIVLEGKPGHGKTALLNAATHIAAKLGLDVVRARCVEGDQLHQGRLIADISRRLGGPDLGGQSHDTDAHGTHRHDTPNDHDALVACNLGQLASQTAGTVLIAIDDAQWIDASSAQWLLESCRGRSEQPAVRVLVAVQPQRPGVVVTALERLVFEHNSRVFTLDPLSVEEVGVMLSHWTDAQPDRAWIEHLYQQTGGVPLFVVLAMKEWIQYDADGRAILDRNAVHSASVVRWVLTRIGALPGGAQSLLEAVSVLGPEADFRVVAAAASLDVSEAARLSESLVDLDILRVGRPLSYSHEIVRASIYADIPVERRWEIHEFAAELLSAKGNVQVAADHLLQTEARNNAWAARTLTDAACQALSSRDFERAGNYAQRALTESIGTPTHPDLSLVLARLAAQEGDPAVVDHIDSAIAHGSDVVGVAATALELVDQLWEAPVRARLLDTLARVRDELRDKDPELALRLEVVETLADRRSLELGTALGDRTGVDERWSASQRDLLRVGSALAAVDACAVASGPTFAEVLHVVRDNITIETVAHSRSRWAATAIVRVLTALVHMGAIDDVAPLLKLARAEAIHDGRDLDAVRLGLLIAEAHTMQGRLDQAESALIQVATTSPPASPWQHLAGIGLDVLLALRGEEDPEPHLSVEPDVDDWRMLGPLDDSHAAEACGWLHLMRCRFQAALDSFTHAELLARARGVENPALTSWRIGRINTLVGLGEGAAVVDLARHNLELADAFGAPTPVARGLSALASTLPLDERVAPLEQAVHMLDGSSNLVDRCWMMNDLGRAYRDVGHTFAARTILRDSADMAVRIGAASLVSAAAEELRAAGARPRRLSTHGSDSLTPAERRVALLAAEGSTNGAIASTLYISMKTVESHLARAYRKLGVKSRAELSGLFGVESSVAESAPTQSESAE
jgi:DNA-binding CsgD family transcriptional regulator